MPTAQHKPSWTKSRSTTPRYIIITLFKDQQKILTAARAKCHSIQENLNKLNI